MNEIKKLIDKVLAVDKRIWVNRELNQTLLLDLVDKIDVNIIGLLLENEIIRATFFVKIRDNYVFKTNEFKFFMEENKVNNSFTTYKNRIGLTDGKRFLKDTNDVVLDFPYKDCILEGGQSNEDGQDSYYEYDETVTKTNEKLGYKAGQYNLKKSKRNEVFFNKVLAKDEIDRLLDDKALVNWKRFTANGECNVGTIKRDDDGVIKENLIIKGNNLLALHSLKKQFAGKVKLIYIDPPYNTGNDSFAYNDKFNHSTWLTFMKNRLEVARDLLRDDGVIFVQCDDNEQAYLKVLLDEIFSKDNFELTIYVQVRFSNKTLNEDMDYQKLCEQIHVFTKTSQFKVNKTTMEYDLSKFRYQIIEKSNGVKECIGGKEVVIFKPEEYEVIQAEPNLNNLKETWATGSLANQGGSAAEFLKLHLEQRKNTDGLCVLYKVIGMGENGDGLGHRYITGPRKITATKGKFYTGVPLEYKGKEIKSKTMPIPNFVDYKEDFTNCRHEGGVALNGGKKPESLIQRIIEISTNEDDIVLDYHLGSGTTAAVAHKMGRQYIGIEQMDYIEDLAVTRLKNVIGKVDEVKDLIESETKYTEFDNSGISKAVNWQGGGEFIYCELAKWNEQAQEQILTCNSFTQLKELFDELYSRYFLNYNLKIKEFQEKVIKEPQFTALPLEQQKEMFLTMLDLNQMYVQKSEMADSKYGLSESDISLTELFYKKG